MRAVVQRVSAASVAVDGAVLGVLDLPADSLGLVAFIGVTHDDTPDHACRLADKIWRLRIFHSDDGPEQSAADLTAPILVISQFTLYANTEKGRRPSWNAAAPGAMAQPLLDELTATLRSLGATVATGRFGADMKVSLTNDGPVTLILDV
ncbi:MAG: D-aminoacyl-tRNA deacylase [Gordonia sp. (in: high G+C Gram-positive bacteria)]|uniref:D-aminoacyl-tRNA deacylase n=1 Tax=Gordonia sp. (in: high G+C Gram-positive bacteria) TaxID=84139 RepID=UPI003BB6880E